MKTLVLIAGFWGAVLVGAWIYSGAAVEQPAGILAPDDPLQTFIVPEEWDRGAVHYTAIAKFEVKARVLSTNQYSYDAGSAISPVDFVLGWGRMSDSSVLKHVLFKQGQRAYTWRPLLGEPLPLPRKEIISHSANMHMIPSDKAIENELLEVRTGEVVEIAGSLVQVRRAGGWSWRTSISRNDTGPGACEVVWVERLSHSAKVVN